jgi:hypothetical protein
MRKIIKIFVLMFLLVISFSLNVFAAQRTDINSLIEHAKALDNKEVTVQGEAIGEMMNRGEYSWVNINDGTNAMGIWIKTAEAEQITSFGDYKHKGDTVKITGIFHRACVEHGGEADIHSETCEITVKGITISERIPSGKLIATVLLVPVAAILFFLYYKKSRKVTAEL